MKNTLLRLWRRISPPLMVVFAILPAPLLLAAICAPALLPLIWLWPAGYFLLDLCSTFVRGKWRILYGIFELGVMAASVALIVDTALAIWVYAIPLIYITLLLVNLPLSYEGRNEQNCLLRYEVIGLLLHLVAQLLYFYSDGRVAALVQIQPWLLTGFFLFIFLGLMLLNQAALPQISGSRLRITGLMKARNGLMTAILLGITLVLALIPSVVSAVSAVFRWLPDAINGLFLLLSKLLVPKTDEDTQVSGPNLDIGGTGGVGGSGTDDTLVTVIVLTMLVAAVGSLIFFLVRASIRFAKFLRKQLQKYLAAVSEDYVDEITDTREDGENQSAGRKGKERKLSKAEQRKLTPVQQIRYRYRLLMNGHPQWHRGSTARENLNADAASVYEQARYSDHPVEEADAQRFAEETKNL